MADTLFLLFYWTGPMGIGAFLLSLGGMIYLLSKADAERRRAKLMEQEKKKA